ncbi:hypothetical protein B4W74_04815 [Staphylococcus intermedius]|nr:hypothetical protein B5C04_04465 [Staphylococcus intermedius]PNZ53763.1 hypothetical protein CD138_04005 [Staphylococcus intermedius NCTC 11048]PCF80987.1 hypothetical protein B4W74_04815 [Staphylococcus intermedius]PCF82269.1 hypothetical protein B4W70_04460 [Staphylococcus intermedius]PCF86969.1 hypothetical protein B4W75_07730 [Staphylococcus intermedius]
MRAITHIDVAQIEVTHMKDSFLWSKQFIPEYFIVAFVVFLLYRFYIHVDHFATYYPVFFCGLLGLDRLKIPMTRTTIDNRKIRFPMKMSCLFVGRLFHCLKVE